MNEACESTSGAGTSWQGVRRVADYYDHTQVLYTHVWSSSGVHYGLWDTSTRSREQAIRNLDRCVAGELGLPAGSRLLDAGCGIGGTSVYLADEFGFDVTGITLSEYQLGKARARATSAGVESRSRFAIGDYLETGFPDESFDGIIAIESSCYAESKPRFLAEAHRILRPGGTLVVSDGFRAGEVGAADRSDYEKMMRGMALTDLACVDEFVEDLGRAGFEDVKTRDKRDAILKSARSIERLSWVGLAVCALPCAVGLFPRDWFHHGVAGTTQRRLFERGVVRYCVHSARKKR